MSRYLASIIKASLFLALSFAQALAQQSEVRLAGSPPGKIVDNEERRELMQRLDQSAPVDINFNNRGGVPVQVREAKVKGVHRDEQRWTKNGESVLSDYAMWARLKLENTTNKNANLVYFKFMDAEGKNVFYASYVVERRKNPLLFIRLMIVTGDPSSLVLEVSAVRFEDDSAWGEMVFPQKGSKESRKAQSEDEEFRAKSLAAVDTRPKLLIRPVGPIYTEAARANRIQGSVRMRLLIGADGAIKQVRVTNALPDGLTEEAIRVAFQMKFSPATKGGAAVDCWNVAQIDFNIK